jgi:hypothetical protein
MEKELIILLQGISISVNGQKTKRMGMVYYNIKMEQYMMDNGRMINLKIKVRLFMLTKINVKAHF